MRKNNKKEAYECPSVNIVGVDIFELMAGSNHAKIDITMDADFNNGTDVDATGGTTDENHTSKTSDGTNIFGY